MVHRIREPRPDGDDDRRRRTLTTTTTTTHFFTFTKLIKVSREEFMHDEFIHLVASPPLITAGLVAFPL